MFHRLVNTAVTCFRAVSCLLALRPGTGRGPIAWRSLFGLLSATAVCWAEGGASVAPQTNASLARAARPPESAREFFNAGTRELGGGKWNEAETFFQQALTRQDESIQPAALYNLGHVRFAQGLEELKKSLAAGSLARRGTAALTAAERGAGEAADALASRDVQRMVTSYVRGRGLRKELREATKAVQRALGLHGAALQRWQRALGDFKSALELSPANTNAQHNVEVTERAIARLVDSIQELQQLMMGLGQRSREMEERLKQLKGQIPEPLMPPGAAGDDEEEEGGRSTEPKPGDKEAESRDGKEMSLSPEEAGWLLEGFKLDRQRRLPMGQSDPGQQEDRKQRYW